MLCLDWTVRHWNWCLCKSTLIDKISAKAVVSSLIVFDWWFLCWQAWGVSVISPSVSRAGVTCANLCFVSFISSTLAIYLLCTGSRICFIDNHLCLYNYSKSSLCMTLPSNLENMLVLCCWSFVDSIFFCGTYRKVLIVLHTNINNCRLKGSNFINHEFLFSASLFSCSTYSFV